MSTRSIFKALIIFLAGIAAGWLLFEIRGSRETGHGHSADPAESQAHVESNLIMLDKAQLDQFKIRLATVGPGNISEYADLPGEVVVDPDRLSHILPRVPGVAVKAMKKLGEPVSRGEVLAILESRELSDLKSAYLVAKDRLVLDDKTFSREETLWIEKISSEREYLVAKRAREEAAIELHSAEQKLASLGFDRSELASMSFEQQSPLTEYRMTAPFDGTVIDKHISIGESLSTESVAFLIADLTSVWVNLSVFQNELHLVRRGQRVEISTADSSLTAEALIDYVGPIIGEETRTGHARVVLDNRSGSWKPGMFVNARVLVSAREAEVVVPVSALFEFEGKDCIFVQTDGGFEPRPVVTGQRNGKLVEVISGVEAGEMIVAEGTFTLKSELSKADFAGEVHGHE
ncbi:MAG: efflux RND transporter periplasmic adaptor subunit [Candidatus Glassbacteria bacterium]